MTFQPYQESAQEELRQSQVPNKLIKQASSVLGGGTVLSSALPFLNPLVPIAIAKKALNLIDPRFGKFFKTSSKLGYNDEQAREFIGEKAAEAQKESPQGQNIKKEAKGLSGQGLKEQFQSRQQQPQAPQGMEFFAQYSPEFAKDIQDQTQMGVNPVEAALSLSRDPRYKGIIRKMEQDSRTPFSSLVRQLLGGVQQAQGGAKENLAQNISKLSQLLQQMQGRP